MLQKSCSIAYSLIFVLENKYRQPAAAGYSSYDNLEYIAEKEIDAYIPDNKMESLEKKEESDKDMTKAILVPMKIPTSTPVLEGKSLTPYGEMKRKGREVIIYRGTDCAGCVLGKKKCTK